MAFDLDPTYKQVPERIADFKALYPTGCLRPADPARPYWFEALGEKTFIVYAAAAYRTADDPMPGIGLAWELYPGKTPYTKESELQNAETSAWGRAIVAVLASESKSVASAEEVRNRQADHAEPDPPAVVYADADQHAEIRTLIAALPDAQRAAVGEWWKEQQLPPIQKADRLTEAQAELVFEHLAVDVANEPTDSMPADLPDESPPSLGGVRAKAKPSDQPTAAERAAARGVKNVDTTTAAVLDAFPGSETEPQTAA